MDETVISAAPELIARLNAALSGLTISSKNPQESSQVEGIKAYALRKEVGKEEEKYFTSLLMFTKDFGQWNLEGLPVAEIALIEYRVIQNGLAVTFLEVIDYHHLVAASKQPFNAH